MQIYFQRFAADRYLTFWILELGRKSSGIIDVSGSSANKSCVPESLDEM